VVARTNANAVDAESKSEDFMAFPSRLANLCRGCAFHGFSASTVVPNTVTAVFMVLFAHANQSVSDGGWPVCAISAAACPPPWPVVECGRGRPAVVGARGGILKKKSGPK
jgi:hypothetical protein